jgi:hypothetical protein
MFDDEDAFQFCKIPVTIPFLDVAAWNALV